MYADPSGLPDQYRGLGWQREEPCLNRTVNVLNRQFLTPLAAGSGGNYSSSCLFRKTYARNASLISLYFPLGMGISVRLDMVTVR